MLIALIDMLTLEVGEEEKEIWNVKANWIAISSMYSNCSNQLIDQSEFFVSDFV